MGSSRGRAGCSRRIYVTLDRRMAQKILTIIQSRCWRGFQQSLQKVNPGRLVATPPDLTFETLQSEIEILRTASPLTYCIQTNIYSPHDTYMIAREYNGLLLCGTYLMNIQTREIAKTNLIEEDGSPTFYLR